MRLRTATQATAVVGALTTLMFWALSPTGNNAKTPRQHIVGHSRRGEVEWGLVLDYIFGLVIICAVIGAPFLLAFKLLNRSSRLSYHYVAAIVSVIVALVIARQVYSRPLPASGTDGLVPIGVAMYQAMVIGGAALALTLVDSLRARSR